MVDVSGQQFIEVSPGETESPKSGGSPDRRAVIALAAVIGVLVLVGLIVLVVNLVRNRQSVRQQTDQAVELLNGAIEEELADCETADDPVACAEALRSSTARSMGEALACESLDSEEAIVNCVSLIALDQLDAEVCQVLKNSERESCEDLVYQTQAVEQSDVELCRQIHDESVRVACLNRVQVSPVSDELAAILAIGDPSACTSFESESERENCEALVYGTDDDRDGLALAFEYELGTSDHNADTDGDGLKDGDEVQSYQTDPTRADTDGDGYNDGDEVQAGYDPLN